jgi:hypothetical protein
MLQLIRWTAVGQALFGTSAMMPSGGLAQTSRSSAAQTIDLAERLGAGKLRVVNREITAVQGTRGVHLSAGGGKGIAWVEGNDFTQGTIELEIRGKDVFQQSFVGVAFHRRDRGYTRPGQTAGKLFIFYGGNRIESRRATRRQIGRAYSDTQERSRGEKHRQYV